MNRLVDRLLAVLLLAIGMLCFIRVYFALGGESTGDAFASMRLAFFGAAGVVSALAALLFWAGLLPGRLDARSEEAAVRQGRRNATRRTTTPAAALRRRSVSCRARSGGRPVRPLVATATGCRQKPDRRANCAERAGRPRRHQRTGPGTGSDTAASSCLAIRGRAGPTCLTAGGCSSPGRATADRRAAAPGSATAADAARWPP